MFQKSSKKIKSQTIWFENIGQFLWKAHSVQDKLWIVPYCHLKDSTCIAIKNSFLLLEIFLKNFNQRHGLIHIVHLVNFGQSLSKSHTVWSMLNFAMFIAKPDQANQCLKHIDQSLNLIALSSILYKFPLKALFCHLKYIWKFWSRTIRVDSYCPFSKIWSIFTKISYNSIEWILQCF